MNKLLIILFYTAIVITSITILTFLVLLYILIWWDVTYINEILMTLFLTSCVSFLIIPITGELLNKL